MKFLQGIYLTIVLLLALYSLGPQPSIPKLTTQLPETQGDLVQLEKEIREKESKVKNLRPDNEARIVWFDKKKKTPYSLVYLHGFTASQAEGDPVHRHLAQRYGCNLYLHRLPYHGINDTEVFKNISPDTLLASAAEALAIAQSLGDSVILMGTSTGASLALYLASAHPEVKALILYSPLVDFYSPALDLLDKPWGLQIARMVMGGKYNERKKTTAFFAQYWTNKIRLEGVVALQTYISKTMVRKTFEKIKQPVFVGYYYKDKQHQDKTVSVKALLRMFGELGSAPTQKRAVAFPEAADHVIGSYITSRDVKGVKQQTYRFAEEVLGLRPVSRKYIQK